MDFYESLSSLWQNAQRQNLKWGRVFFGSIWFSWQQYGCCNGSMRWHELVSLLITSGQMRKRRLEDYPSIHFFQLVSSSYVLGASLNSTKAGINVQSPKPVQDILPWVLTESQHLFTIPYLPAGHNFRNICHKDEIRV